ncbi:hypothetical protein QVD17_19693 [Tagetes erecta]|uniref:Integrase catalytic domain-containing protein n=1 Tax=Tagetes erecta TaxID=13708 RepID=A0AAD8KJV8_TARER|nr:hypothetical protein QVD17_19693 [Tagetes erecta]
MDLFGPTNVQSIGKKSYCLVIIDDFTRFSWVYFLHAKSETAELLTEFNIKVENQLESRVKILRSDNGTEFKNVNVDSFGAEKGIVRQFSAPRTPQQNGVTDRKNRTLIEAARSMLADGKSKKELGDLGSFSDDSDNDDDDDLNSEYPFMSFCDPHVESSNHSQDPSVSQEAQESNNEADLSNQQNSPDDGGSVLNQPSLDPNGEVTPESLDYFINSPIQVPNFTPHTSTLLQDLPNLNESNLEMQIQREDIPTSRVHKNHPISQIIGPLNQRTMRSQTEQAKIYLKSCFLFQVVSKNILEPLQDNSWIEAMKEELLQFRKQEVWKLVDLPEGENAIGTRWLYKNKPDEHGIVVRNKARLIAQGYT